MTIYAWSHISRVYHEVEDQAAHGWVDTVCCGERWIDCTADQEPDLSPCLGLAPVFTSEVDGRQRTECVLCGRLTVLFVNGVLAAHNCIPIRARA